MTAQTGHGKYMAARVNKIRHDDNTRAKIQATQIINRLHKCIMGEVELSATQVSAGKTLLDKVLPNLQAVAQETEITVNTIAAKPLTPEEWAAMHTGNGE